jgi:transposase
MPRIPVKKAVEANTASSSKPTKPTKPSKRITTASANKRARAVAEKKPGKAAASPPKAVTARKAGAPPKAAVARKAGAPPKASVAKKAGAPPEASAARKAGAPPEASTARKAGAPPKAAAASKAPTPTTPVRDTTARTPEEILSVLMAMSGEETVNVSVERQPGILKDDDQDEKIYRFSLPGPDDDGLPVVLRNVAGIDISSREHMVCVRPPGSEPIVTAFLTETEDLRMMSRFLSDHGVETVAMESTGIYSSIVYKFLQKEGFRCMLLDPSSVKAVKGRKTDVRDCQQIQKLVSCGIPNECFVPTEEISAVRNMMRARSATVREKSDIARRLHKTLRLANINLEHAVTDITGQTGMRIINAIIDGERDPCVLATLRDTRCKKSAAEIARCLDGFYTVDTVVLLRFYRDQYLSKQAEVEALDGAILAYMEHLEPANETVGADGAAPAPGRPLTGASKGMERMRDELVRIVGNGVDLTMVPGISVLLALVIISEIGTDMTRWPTVKHFASWLGLCPGDNTSGGKVISSASRKVHSPASQAFILAARSVGRTDTSIGDFYRGKKFTRGGPKALTATAHLIARIVYAMLRDRAPYKSETKEEREMKKRARKESKVTKLASQLGYKQVPAEELAA